MLRLNRYLINNFFTTFFPLFAILFIVASMVLLLTISNMTAVLKINLWEFLYLYFLSLPEIIFYTLPLSVFIGSAVSIAKLFENSELLTILALGIEPKRILRPFLYIAIITSFILLIITFFSIPTSQILYKNFFNAKKIESQFNFSPSAIGQKFGEWNLFIKSKKGKKYRNIVMYNNKKEILITAQKAKTFKKANYFILSLENGHLYQKGEKTTILSFEKFNINQKIELTNISFNSIGEYLRKYKKKSNRYLIIALFPLVGYLFLAPVSFFHNRYQQNHSIFYSGIVTISYYVATFILYKNLFAIFIIIPIFFIISLPLKRKVKQF